MKYMAYVNYPKDGDEWTAIMSSMETTVIDLTGVTVKAKMPAYWELLDGAVDYAAGWIEGKKETEGLLYHAKIRDEAGSEVTLGQALTWRIEVKGILRSMYGVEWNDGFGCGGWFNIPNIKDSTPLEAAKEYANHYDLDRIDSLY